MVWKNMSKYKISNINKRYHDKLKHSLIKLLGGSCKNCGEIDMDVLVTDHKFNDGIKERKNIDDIKLRRIYLKNPIIAKKRLQVLCHNCNLKKQIMNTEFKRLERYEIPPF